MAEMELLEFLQKSHEENMAAQEAIAQGLSKMLKKQDMRDTAEEEMQRKMNDEKLMHEKEEMEKARWDAMAKSVTDNVIATVKQMYQGLEVTAAKPHNVDGGDVKLPAQKWPMNEKESVGDLEVPAKTRVDTKEVQKPIQAQYSGTAPTQDEVKPEGASEYPVVEDENKEMPNPEEMRKVYSEMKALRDEMVNVKKSFTKNVETEVEKRLAASGVHKDKSFATKVMKPAELGGAEPISKSADMLEKDPIEVLSKVPTAALMNEWLKTKGPTISNGVGVPREITIKTS